MKDAIFVADLFTNALLPDDVKDRVESCATSAEKASYFLDHVIKPSVTSGVSSNFDKFLKVMEDSKYLTVNELAKQIKRERCKRSNTAIGKLASYKVTNYLICRNFCGVKISCYS